MYLGPFHPPFMGTLSRPRKTCARREGLQVHRLPQNPQLVSLFILSLHTIFRKIHRGSWTPKWIDKQRRGSTRSCRRPCQPRRGSCPPAQDTPTEPSPPTEHPRCGSRRRSCQLQKHSNTMPVCSRVYEARVLLDRPWLLKSHQECGVALAVSRTSPFPVHLRLALGGCVQTGRAGPITLVQGFGLFWPFFGPRVSSLAVFATVPGSQRSNSLITADKRTKSKKKP